MIATLGRWVCLFVLTAAAPLSQAAYLVDTGTPTETNGGGLSISNLAGYYQSAGATFNITSATTIGAIETFGSAVTGGTLDLALYSGMPGGKALFRKSIAISTSAADSWLFYSGLDWKVHPGIYTVTFEPPPTGFLEATVTIGAPHPMQAYWYGQPQVDDGPVVWKITTGSPTSDFAIRVSPVPEPSSLVVFPLGLCLIGGVAMVRRNRTGMSDLRAARVAKSMLADVTAEPRPRQSALQPLRRFEVLNH